jgi:hypothetical protein
MKSQQNRLKPWAKGKEEEEEEEEKEHESRYRNSTVLQM